MKKLLFGLFPFFICGPVFATPNEIYNLNCVLFIDNTPKFQKCRIKDIRTHDGGLIQRIIDTDNYHLDSWITETGVFNRDSKTKPIYSWKYKSNRQGYSQVSPVLNVHNISWD